MARKTVSVSSPASIEASRPSLRDLGLHRLALLILLLNGAVILATVPFYESYGLEISWPTVAPSVIAIGFAAIGWLAHYFTPGRGSEWAIPNTFVVFSLIALCFAIVTPAQYLAVALNRPLADPWLARADAMLGISVPDIVLWTKSYPLLVSILVRSYYSLALQFTGVLVLLGLYFRDTRALWEYCFNFHFCLVLTLVGLALFPAMCSFSYYGFESLIDQTRFIQHFDALRAGSFRELHLTKLEGLITFPSFHVAGGLMVTWAFRRYRWMFLALFILNSLMIASTVLLGPHYAVDIIASFVLFGLSAWLYCFWARHLMAARKSKVATDKGSDENVLSPVA